MCLKLKFLHRGVYRGISLVNETLQEVITNFFSVTFILKWSKSVRPSILKMVRYFAYNLSKNVFCSLNNWVRERCLQKLFIPGPKSLKVTDVQNT